MKFKTIFIVFNLVILLSFLSVFLVPMLLLGAGYFPLFVSRNWIAALLFAAAFAVVNLYFLHNWRLFRFLEAEDWPGLIRYLEAETAGGARPGSSLLGGGLRLRLLVNAYLLSSSLEKVRDLEARLAESSPRFLLRFPLAFAIPRLLSGDPGEAERYFAERLSRPGLRRRDWMQWNRAFALVQAHRLDEAAAQLEEVRAGTREPVLVLLALYLSGSAVSGEQGRQRVAEDKRRFRRKWNRGRLTARIEGTRANLEVLVLSRILKDALEWLYGDDPARGAEAGPPDQDRRRT